MRVAVIGAGAVGASAAYYLSRAKDVELTVFDEGLGQATKAAAGIISPWFSNLMPERKSLPRVNDQPGNS